MRKTYRIITFLIFIFFCAYSSFVYAKKVRFNRKYNPEKSYIYGQFFRTCESGVHDWNMGIVIQNADTRKKYTVRFHDKERVTCEEVQPGIYRIVELVYLVGNKTIGRDDVSSHDIAKKFNIEKGHAMYIGDWKITITQAKQTDYREIGSYNIDSIDDNCEETTDKFHTQYKYFQPGVPTECWFDQ